jgi:hypothetical protein
MISGNSKNHEEISQRLKDTAGVQMALKQAAHDAIQQHVQAGQKIVVWRNNQVVWEDPAEAGDQTQSSSGAE